MRSPNPTSHPRLRTTLRALRPHVAVLAALSLALLSLLAALVTAEDYEISLTDIAAIHEANLRHRAVRSRLSGLSGHHSTRVFASIQQVGAGTGSGTGASGGSGAGVGGNASKAVVVGKANGNFAYTFNPGVNYAAWSALQSVYPGDALVFKYPFGSDEIYRFASQADYDTCSYASARRLCRDGEGVRGCRVAAELGTMYFASGMLGRCQRMHKVSIRVKARPYVPRRVVVGRATAAFKWPWNPAVDYAAWARDNKVYVGDVLVFKYEAYMDEVYIVPTLADYTACNYENYIAYCNATDGMAQGCSSAPLTASTMYFLSGSFSHCSSNNHRVAITASPPPS
ncbi:hypothetical protein CLOM_g8955 [Closterium sp. NIES-68]|nr:hypothetical protein CLOM_g8955 [Closterium sp. NIES-68]GJP84832.1 hypothetical protein CLOP_g14882 [Closterium sp. NIES-67]